MNQVRELQMQTLLSAMSAKNSPLATSEMHQAVERMVMIHGEGFRLELEDRLRRSRPAQVSDIDRGRLRDGRPGYDDYDYDRRRREPFGGYDDLSSRGYGLGSSRSLASRDPLRSLLGTTEERRRQLRDTSYTTSRSDGGWRPQSRGRNETGPNRQRREKFIQKGVVLLFPNPPDVPLPGLSPKPPGCTTVYVGGLPPRCLERHVRDAFSDCGAIKAIRIGRGKGFAHVEYEDEDAVDRAVAMSGWRIKVDRTQHAEAIGRMHVDYAHDRKKQQEQKSKEEDSEKGADKDGRKRRRSDGDSDDDNDEIPAKRQRSSSETTQEKPSNDTSFIKDKQLVDQAFSHEASAEIQEHLGFGEQYLRPCTQQIVKWMNSGKCSESTRDDFFSLLQAVHAHLKRLLSVKKSQCEAANSFQRRMAVQHGILLRQTGYVENVLKVASSEKLESIFSKGQVKSLSIWLTSLKTLKADTTETVVTDELKSSTVDDPPVDAEKDESSMTPEECVEYWKERHTSVEQQLKFLQAKMSRLRHQCHEVLQHKNDEVSKLKASLSKVIKEEKDGEGKDGENQSSWAEQTSFLSEEDFSGAGYDESVTVGQEDLDSEMLDPNLSEEEMMLLDEDVQPALSAVSSLSNESAALLSVVVAYLIVHPFGAPISDICNYMKGLGCTVEQEKVEELLMSLPLVFRLDNKEDTPVWLFCGFQTIGLPLKTAAECAIACADESNGD